jgi:hypothetical protein
MIPEPPARTPQDPHYSQHDLVAIGDSLDWVGRAQD